jgi:hypothetical protein
MSKLIGLVLIVIGIWVGLEVYQNGTHGAFGGALAALGDGPGEDGVRDTRTAPQRAGDAARRARDEASARRERLLAE